MRWLSFVVLLLAQTVSAQDRRVAVAPQPQARHAKPEGAVRVMAFNLWQEGTSVPGGFDKIVAVVVASQADVVAISEVRNYQGRDLHGRLVKALAAKGQGYHGKFGGGDVGVLSRWPVVKTDVVVDGRTIERGSIIAYYLRDPGGRELVVCSAHLDYRNYAVYLPRGYDGNSFKEMDADGDGTPDAVTELEQLHAMDKASARDDALKAFVAYVKKQGLSKRDVILAGDFNECSHLDWTKATRELFSHNGVVIEWQNSMRLHEAGFRDSWRQLYPNPVTHPGATWPSPAWQKGSTSWAAKVDERDRIDFIYHNGRGLTPQRAWLVGPKQYYVRNQLVAPATSDPFALTALPWPSDHKAVMVDFVRSAPAGK